MFDIKICDLAAAPLLCAGWGNKAMSFLDEAPRFGFFADINPANHLLLIFHDIDHPMPPYVHPTRQHLDQVLKFSETFQPTDRVVIHCHAGISRSTSMATAALMNHGLSYEEAFERTKRARPMLWPNRLIVQYTDDAFGLDGEYAQFIADWKKADLAQRAHSTHRSAESVEQMKGYLNLFR